MLDPIHLMRGYCTCNDIASMIVVIAVFDLEKATERKPWQREGIG
jgi:hypothetical protein